MPHMGRGRAAHSITSRSTPAVEASMTYEHRIRLARADSEGYGVHGGGYSWLL